ncbi:MAG TPA: sigma 54-interacting transcriptional regulator [bacterium]|nr:sigma 54-interacting transcriptional regulator [bacterium]
MGYTRRMWRVESRLESGGVGDIYIARTPAGERVALKVLRSSASLSASVFEKEVLLLSKLRHPHIVSILGCSPQSDMVFGKDSGPCYWMEYVDGSDLLSASREANPETVFRWLVQGLEALEYLHRQGVLHGDLSPRNLLIDRDGRLKLLDFGLAAIMGKDASAIEAATVPYLAPERLGGIQGPASDLFALGTVFYEALARRHPRAGAAGLHEMMSADAPSLVETAPTLEASHSVVCRVIDGLIQNDLSRRFSRAEEALSALRGGTSPKPSRPAEFHSLTFWGASPRLERVAEALKNIKDKSQLFALHGSTGTGKKRFLREVAFQAALAGIPVFERRDGNFRVLSEKGPDGVYFFRSLETLSLTELSRLLSLRRSGLPAQGRVAVLEWNDDFADAERRQFLAGLSRWPEVADLPLANLGRDEAFHLIRSASGGAFHFSEDVAGDLFRQTGGNPGLLIEVLSRLRAGESPEDVESVRSWREILLWKVLALPEPEKAALAFIAAADRPVATELIPHPESLSRLTERQLLRFDPGTGTYAPALPLLPEVMEELLIPSETLEIHRHWLRILKGVSPQRLHHALAVKDAATVAALARPVSDLLWTQERKKESLKLVGRAIDLLRGDGNAQVETARLLKEKMSLLNDLGQYEEALEAAEEWFALGPDNDPPSLKSVKYWFFTGMLHQNLSRDDEAAGRLRRCLETGDETDADQRPFLTRAHMLLGNLDKALSLAESKGRRRAEIHRHLAEADPGRAFEHLDLARSLYEEDGFEQGVFACFLQEGNLSLESDPERAKAAYAKAEEIALRLDNDALLAQAWHNLGVLARRQGRLGEALELLPKAFEIFEMLSLEKEREECRKNLELARAAVGETQDLPAAFKAGSVKRSKPKENVMETSPPLPFDWEPIAARLAELERELLRETDMDIVLRRLMDSAMELARAQHGFLLLRADEPEPESPVPGFTVAVARNLNRESLKSSEHVLSLSVVHRAMETGEPVATDNALQDPRFRDAKSVHLGQLKSILALPVPGPQGILGVFYLDHPLKDGLFQGDVLRSLKLFAGLAAIALQKGRLIEELKDKNENLSTRVDEQASQMERLAQEVKETRLKLKNEYGDVVGRSPRMLDVLTLVDKVTDTKIPVWIFGETGTGKESIARALHFNSSRKNQPFVTENCSALPESLLESELFGHKKGAFTHATADKKGLLHYADKGTIFLDEIADMSVNLQAKLLRFLQEGEIRPLGSHQVIKVDVRVVSASNKDLRKLVAEGTFREDLFFRLNGITVKLPPLRERFEDLPLLAEHFLKGKAKLKPDVLKLLMSYPWPGNVRELQQTLETALIFAEDGMITRKSLEFKDALFTGAPPPKLAPVASPSTAAGTSKTEMTPDLERILRAIRDQCYHKGKAAEALGMSRRHLYTKLEGYGIPADSRKLKDFIEKNLG